MQGWYNGSRFLAWTVYSFLHLGFSYDLHQRKDISVPRFFIYFIIFGVLEGENSCARHGFRGKTMKLKYVLLVAVLFVGNSMFAQKTDFTRGKGFLIRPELYNGFFVNGGYQVNPFFQVSLGAGVTIDPVFLSSAGVRVYTNEGHWAGMFDYHVRIGKYSGYLIADNALIGGASYKDLDFGIGIHLMSVAGQLGFGPSVSVGWNIRFYDHR